MGCDWVAIRNLATALGIFVGLATSSAYFVILWHRFAPNGFWKPMVTAASAASAAAWCVPAMTMLAILMSVVGSFCRCAAGLPPAMAVNCTGLCPMLTSLMTALMVGLIALMVLCITVSADGGALLENPAFLFVFIAGVTTVMTLMALVAVWAGNMVVCQ